ncbi:enhancer binding protein Nla6 [Hyalangium rubrum]|uniref:Sigma-54 dependent transcriptional regulator n=1 Tax=Hyalangium rubrum TaxID=3103134 RepID=A0ABU5H368_9BACT|nr:sigma-54 dependent transcriptional regulator [Hyalangium sp. s54d21]MDY7227931.1 sigma-54 dependent transcriptional regulator [Hyalangium sp. s54d21]
MGSARILAVDDERATCEALAEMLSSWGHKVEVAFDGHDALRRAGEFRPDVVLSDLAMPETDGLWLLRQLREELPDCPVVFLTGRGTIDAAVAAIKEGAYDFIEKPLNIARLKVCIERALEKKETLREVQTLRRRLKQLGQSDLIAQSGAMRKVGELIEKVAPSKASVAISGESGTGKEVVARAIHNLSLRREKPFIAINCASIPATLIESEFFGHERGAFTGADQRRPGVFELAHGGTLFLDELGEIPIELQAKLLRVLEEGRLRRLGGKVEIEVDVRVLCATNRDLKQEIKNQRFREDLYFRLNVFQIHLPPLRERREDIPILVQHFVEKFRGDSAKRVTGVHPEAMEVLKGHEWPGNIRELRNAVERAVILCDGELITREHLPPDMAGKSPERHTFRLPYGLSLDAVEREYILGSLQRNGNNKARTAEILGVSEKTLYNKLNRYAAEARQQGGQNPAGNLIKAAGDGSVGATEVDLGSGPFR